ncbi:hypothetical protein [Coleofasciculus sp.]|uniref:hypothetical protein n=1 Tax=Coleofasciculus sp. TaxID=3100458 RepID=UPI003A1A4CA7
MTKPTRTDDLLFPIRKILQAIALFYLPSPQHGFMIKLPLKTIRITSASFLTALFTTALAAQSSQATTLSPTQQVEQVVQWFTGFFTNSTQVANNPDIPFLTMENCSASALGSGNPAAQYVHLEQYIGGTNLLRAAGTPIEFQRVAKTPEPMMTGALIGFGVVGLVARRKQ